MKIFFALLTAMTISSISHAELKPPGTFLPSKCSPVQYKADQDLVNPIREICFGSLTGGYGIKAQQAVAVSRILPNAKREVLTIENVIPKEVMSGNGEIFVYKLLNKNGETRDLEVIVENGKVIKTRGQDGAAEFIAEQFQIVFNTMSIKTIL